MPSIFQHPKKVYQRKYKTKRENINHTAVYNTKRWRTVRLEKLKRDPLCQICLSLNKVTPGEEVHHITPISSGKTVKDKQALGFNPANLKTLCKACHEELHNDNHRLKNQFSTETKRGSSGFSFV